MQLAQLVARGEPCEMRSSFDMWQLGMLLYQLASQPWPYRMTYWDTAPELGDDDILELLILYSKTDTPANDPNRALLPHERSPLEHPPLREVISNLLAPTAAARWTSEQLRVFLELNTTPLTQQGQTTVTSE